MRKEKSAIVVVLVCILTLFAYTMYIHYEDTKAEKNIVASVEEAEKNFETIDIAYEEHLNQD